MKTVIVASASLLAFGVVASASVPGARLLEDGHDGVLEDAMSIAALQAPHGGWEWTPPPAGDPSKMCTAPGWMGPSSPEQWVPSGMTPWNRGRKLKSASKTPKAGKWRAPRPSKSDETKTCSAGAECRGYSMLKVASIEGEGGGPGELFTTLDAGNQGRGVMFQIKAKKAMVINSFKLHLKSTAGTTVDVKVWHRSGSYEGYKGSSIGWTEALDDVTITSAGEGALTDALPTLDPPATLTAGQEYSFYILTNSNFDLMWYTSGGTEFDWYAYNDDLEFFEGRGCDTGEFGTSCDKTRIFNGAILYDIPSPPVPGSWTQFAMLAGRSGVRAYPGTTGDDLGTLENCVLAPVASKDELADMILEVRRIVVNLVLAEGGTVAEADNILENESFWLGVVKAPAQVAADNGGNGSRLGWKNLDGTPADVCDADWLGVGAGGGEQPDGSTDGALDTRLVLVDGQLKDYPDSGEDVVYAIYKCCMATIAFSSCDAVA